MYTFIECIFVEITQKFTKNIIVGCVNRPPNTDIVMFNTELSNILDSINANSTKLALILGDFNIDLVKSDVHTPTSDFLNNFTTHSFLQTIPSVSKYIMYSSALVLVRTCTSWHLPQQEARKPPRMEGTTIFLILFITTTIKKIPHCPIMQF